MLNYLLCFLIISDEADDISGECGTEPQHPPGQHTETVWDWAQQNDWQESQWETGITSAEEEGGTPKLHSIFIYFMAVTYNM